MKRILLIIVLLGLVWALAYALAYTLRERHPDGFRYPPGGRFDIVLAPVFDPLYRVHGMIDPARDRRHRDAR